MDIKFQGVPTISNLESKSEKSVRLVRAMPRLTCALSDALYRNINICTYNAGFVVFRRPTAKAARVTTRKSVTAVNDVFLGQTSDTIHAIHVKSYKKRMPAKRK